MPYRLIAFFVWINLMGVIAGNNACADQNFDWQVLTNKGGGIPQVEIADNILLGSREEVVASKKNRMEGKRVVCVRSQDGGRNWEDIGVIVESIDPDIDLGDGSMIKINKVVCYIYRFNKFKGRYLNNPYYSIRVKQSNDGGRTWMEHSIVEEISPSAAKKSGLWTPRLFYTSNGRLQAYYDDSNLPEMLEGGANRGQWGVVKIWNESKRVWERGTVVSRPPVSTTGPLRISAEGPRTPIELNPGHIFVPVESNILDDVPHSRSIALRYVESFDYGATWSWNNGNWPILYAKPPKLGGEYYDWSWPLAATFKCGGIVVLFRSNELSKVPTKGTAFNSEKYLFYIFSLDNGKTWKKDIVYSSVPVIGHGVVSMKDGSVIAGIRSKLSPKTYIIVRGKYLNSLGCDH